jgi:hypothetical protein
MRAATKAWRDAFRERRLARRARQAAGAGGGEDEAEAEGDWKDQLIARLLQLPPDGFERLAQRILREAGFVNVTVTGKRGRDTGRPHPRRGQEKGPEPSKARPFPLAAYRPPGLGVRRDRDVRPGEALERHRIREARERDAPWNRWGPVRVGARLLCQELLFRRRGH